MKKFLFLVWDFFIWIGIYFPFVIGGFWIQKPGFFIEWTQLTLPVVIVFTLGFIGKKYLNWNIKKASSINFFVKILEKYEIVFQKNKKMTLFFVWFFFGALWSLRSLFRHFNFKSHEYDLGIFDNVLWNLVNGYGYISSVKNGANLFTDHQSPILWLVAPFYWLFQRSEFLLIFQGFFLALGGIALYLLVSQKFKEQNKLNHWIVIFSPFIYWFYRPIRSAYTFDFHPETLLLPFVLFGVWGVQEKKLKFKLFGFFCVLLALMTKETAAIVLIGISISWFIECLKNKNIFLKNFSIFILLLSFAVLYFNLKILPGLFGNHYSYMNLYAELGENFTEIIFSPILKPFTFLEHITNYYNLRFLFGCLVGLAFLPLFNWPRVLACIPPFMIIFLISTGEHTRNSLGFHYAIEPASALFFALPGALFFASKRIKNFHWLLLFFVLVGFGRSEIYHIRRQQLSPEKKWYYTHFFPCIGTTDLAASGFLVPHLSNRHWIRSLDTFKSGPNKTPISCIIEDNQFQSLTFNPLENGYEKTYDCHGTSVFQLQKDDGSDASKENKSSCLKCLPRCRPH